MIYIDRIIRILAKDKTLPSVCFAGKNAFYDKHLFCDCKNHCKFTMISKQKYVFKKKEIETRFEKAVLYGSLPSVTTL
jgi:hypothetical protein